MRDEKTLVFKTYNINPNLEATRPHDIYLSLNRHFFTGSSTCRISISTYCRISIGSVTWASRAAQPRISGISHEPGKKSRWLGPGLLWLQSEETYWFLHTYNLTHSKELVLHLNAKDTSERIPQDTGYSNLCANERTNRFTAPQR